MGMGGLAVRLVLKVLRRVWGSVLRLVVVRAGVAMFMGVIVLLFVVMLVSASLMVFSASAYAQHCGGCDGGDECVSEIHGSVLLSVNGRS